MFAQFAWACQASNFSLKFFREMPIRCAARWGAGTYDGVDAVFLFVVAAATMYFMHGKTDDQTFFALCVFLGAVSICGYLGDRLAEVGSEVAILLYRDRERYDSRSEWE